MKKRYFIVKALIITLPLGLGLVITLGSLLALAKVLSHRNLSLTRVTYASDANRDSLAPTLNLSGTKIAFESNSDFLHQGIPVDPFEIWLFDTSTMSYTRITTGSSGASQKFLG